jgi:inhibitor of KinA
MMSTLELDIVPLGDQAVLIDAHTHDHAVALTSELNHDPPAWLHDVVPAYHRVGVYFDLLTVDFAEVKQWILHRRSTLRVESSSPSQEGRLHTIPVCYTLGPDLADVAIALKLTPQRVIELHTGTTYRIFAIGFVPGFPYLGELPVELRGLPRLATPRVQVEPGSVGLTGNQTGIYPLARPGGWNLIGRTPLEIVNEADDFFPLRVGDSVRFTPISETEFEELKTGLDRKHFTTESTENTEKKQDMGLKAKRHLTTESTEVTEKKQDKD